MSENEKMAQGILETAQDIRSVLYDCSAKLARVRSDLFGAGSDDEEGQQLDSSYAVGVLQDVLRLAKCLSSDLALTVDGVSVPRKPQSPQAAFTSSPGVWVANMMSGDDVRASQALKPLARKRGR